MKTASRISADFKSSACVAELHALDAAGQSRFVWERLRTHDIDDDTAPSLIELYESLRMRFGQSSDGRGIVGKATHSPALLQSFDRWSQGRKASAILLLQRFLNGNPKHRLARLHLALFYMESGQARGAQALLAASTEEPDAPAMFCLARIRMGAACWDEAATLLESVPSGIARQGEREWLLADCHRMLGNRSRAIDFFALAAEAACPVSTFWIRYAGFLGEEAGGEAEAAAILESGDSIAGGTLEYALQAARICRGWIVPGYDQSGIWLSEGLKRGGDERSILPELIYSGCRQFKNGKNPGALGKSLRFALDLHQRYPDEPEAAFALGNVLFYYNRVREGLSRIRSGFRPGRQDWMQKSIYLFHSNYDETLSVEELVNRHRELGREIETALPELPAVEPVRQATHSLRVGFVSPDLRNHPVGYFLDSVCEHFDESRIEAFFYASKTERNEVAQRFRARPGWRDITALSDRAAAERIRADGIHILVDVAGFTADHRLPLFALRPAPVQVSWLGYPGSTGLTRIDYRLSDAMVDPPGVADERSSEKIFRLPNGFHAFRPPFPYPRVMPLPALKEKVITFGCFNNLHKVNARVIALWAAILNAVPNSRLLLKHDNLAVPQNQTWLRESFHALGVEENRIHLKGRTDTLIKHVGCYNWLDIALDPFPYNGTTTTCDALYMGVPVICLEGDRHAARVSASFMKRLKLDDWVASDEADYVRIARSKAADLDALSALRSSLRRRFRQSPLGRPAALAADLEQAFRTMWQRHASGNAHSFPKTATQPY